MFTLLTTIVSFLSGGIPRILDFFQDRNDKKHELDMANLQFTRELELQKAGLNKDKDILGASIASMNEVIFSKSVNIATLQNKIEALNAALAAKT